MNEDKIIWQALKEAIIHKAKEKWEKDKKWYTDPDSSWGRENTIYDWARNYAESFSNQLFESLAASQDAINRRESDRSWR